MCAKAKSQVSGTPARRCRSDAHGEACRACGQVTRACFARRAAHAPPARCPVRPLARDRAARQLRVPAGGTCHRSRPRRRALSLPACCKKLDGRLSRRGGAARAAAPRACLKLPRPQGGGAAARARAARHPRRRAPPPGRSSAPHKWQCRLPGCGCAACLARAAPLDATAPHPPPPSARRIPRTRAGPAAATSILASACCPLQRLGRDHALAGRGGIVKGLQKRRILAHRGRAKPYLGRG
jgi:hypothetical protein